MHEEIIKYRETQKLELWIRDTGMLDAFHVYLNDNILREISDGRVHAYPIRRPTECTAVVVRFDNAHGNRTAIVDVTREKIKLQERADHTYLIRAVE